MISALSPINNTMYCIFPNSEDSHVATFDVDQLKDIVNHGMSGGVSGFIYTKDNVAWFNENSDEIEEFLSDWYSDNLGESDYIGKIAGSDHGGSQYPVCSIDELKTRMVWAYVELKADEILANNGYEY